jgi:hypothetical protein
MDESRTLTLRDAPPPELDALDENERAQAAHFAKRLLPGVELDAHFGPECDSFANAERWQVETTEGELLDVWLVAVPRGIVFRAGTTTQVGEIFDANLVHALGDLALLPGSAAKLRNESLLARFGRRAEFLRKYEEATNPGAPPPGPDFGGEIAPGTFAYARWKGRWWPARVLSQSGAMYRVHYDGWEASWDEYVSRERLCQAPRTSSAKLGDAVSVEYRGAWYSARVLHVHEDGRLRITYEGWDSSWDEDVVPARVKHTPQNEDRPGRDLGGEKPGQGSSMFIEYDGAWYEGVVLEVRADGYLIHYDGWDSSWDEVVDSTRLRFR